MHNRSRVVCASFLVKNLLLPWQWGLKHYWDAQLDADLECDALGWQYVSGCLAGAPRPCPGPPDAARASRSRPLRACPARGPARNDSDAALSLFLPGRGHGAPAPLNAPAVAMLLGACASCPRPGTGNPVRAVHQRQPWPPELAPCPVRASGTSPSRQALRRARGAPCRRAPLLIPDGPRGGSQALRPGRALRAPLAARAGAHARQVDPQARPRAAQPPPGPGSVL